MDAIKRNFKAAELGDKWGTVVFYVVLGTSAFLAIYESPVTNTICHIFLIISSVFAILATAITTFYQTEGNRALRLSQLGNALGASIGEVIRPDYYNSNLPKNLLRLAATTLENTHFTKETLLQMVKWIRLKAGVYFILLLILSVCRETPTSWLLVLAQTLFSADLALKWMRLERFRYRTVRVYDHLEQFFAQGGGIRKPNDLAILLAAFTDYECAKDEAAIPLDGKYFEKINVKHSEKWNEIKQRFNIK